MSRTMNAATCCLLAIVFALVASETALAGKTPPPVPVEYRLTWTDAPEFDATHLFGLDGGSGVAVGQGYPSFYGGALPTSAIICTPMSLRHVDELSSLWTDLVDGSHPTGWSAAVAKDINSKGQIVGTAIQNGVWASGRAFIYDPTRGFLLLPNPPENGIPCRYTGLAINEYGEVLGEYYVNADYALWRFFFWTEANPLQINLTPVGEACDNAGMAMSDAYFGSYVEPGANVNNGLDWKLYSYSVADGIFSYSLHTQFTAVQLGGMNSNHLLPLIAKTVKGRVTTYNVCIYNPATRQTTPIAPSDWRGVGNMNTAGDVVFNGPDGAMPLYRNREKTAYKIYDLLDAAGKSQFAQATSIVTKRAQVNDSNVGIVPQTDPFDHIAGNALFTISGKSYPRGFVLTPVAK